MNIKALAITIVAAAFSLSACSVTGKETSAYGKSAAQISLTDDEIVKTLKLSGFDEIYSSAYVSIRYTQGSGYKVVARGTAKAFADADIFVSGGTLTINNKEKGLRIGGDDASDELKLEITAPDINNICNVGKMSFTTQSFKTRKLTISNSGVLDFDGDEASSRDTKIVNQGVLHLAIDVKGASMDYGNSGVCTTNGTFTLDESYKYVNQGKSDFDGSVTARDIDISNTGVDTQSCKLKSDDLKMSVGGRSDYDMSFTGGRADLTCSGVGDFDLSLDCRRIDVMASGRIGLELSGTADNTDFTGSGVSNIDTSRLNKF